MREDESSTTEEEREGQTSWKGEGESRREGKRGDGDRRGEVEEWEEEWYGRDKGAIRAGIT